MAKAKYDPPLERSPGDHFAALARAGAGSIPVLGAAATEVLNHIVTPPLERRRDEWRKSVGEALNNLAQAHYLRLEDLQKNEAFISTVAQASAAAIRCHQAEKLNALRNAVLNAAIPGAPDEALQQMYVAMVDRFTEWHLRILRLLRDPRVWFDEHSQQPPDPALGISPFTTIKAAYEQLADHRTFCERVVGDLEGHGLLDLDTIYVVDPETKCPYRRATTHFGEGFFLYISDPATNNA